VARFFKNPWWVVFGSILGLTVGSGPITLFTFGVLLKPITAEFGWKRATVASATTVAQTLSAIATPFVGKLIDRWGIRRVTLPFIAAFAVSTAAVSRTSASPMVFVLIYGLSGLASSGQGVVGYAKAISAWFEARRGLALGIAMAGIGIGSAVIPQLTQVVIDRYGWRDAYVFLGLITFCLAFPAVALFVRMPDKVPAGEQDTLRVGSAQDAAGNLVPGMTAREAVTGSFRLWFIGIAVFLVALSVNGTIAHIFPILTDRGVTKHLAALALSISGLSLIGGRILSGYLLDRLFAPYVAASFFLVPLLGILLLASKWAGSTPLFGAACLGLSIGAEIDIMAFLVGRYFGLRTFGEIYGYLVGLFIFGSGLGPLLMGICFDRTGSYDLAFRVSVVALAVASILISRLGPYVYPAKERPGIAVAPSAASES
jgi:MFS family permease